MGSLREKWWEFVGWDRFKRQAKLRFAPAPVDTTQFEDAIADSIPWQPHQRYVVGFRHRLTVVPGTRAVYRVTLAIKAAWFLMPLAIILFLGFAVSWGLLQLIGIPMAVVLYALALYFYWIGASTIVFDRSVNAFWTGRYHRTSNSLVPLSQIHAVQLLGFTHCSGRRITPVLQLNMVLNDATRVHVITMPNHPISSYRDAMFADAKALAVFLDAPLWNGAHELDRPRPGETWIQNVVIGLVCLALASVGVYAYHQYHARQAASVTSHPRVSVSPDSDAVSNSPVATAISPPEPSSPLLTPSQTDRLGVEAEPTALQQWQPGSPILQELTVQTSLKSDTDLPFTVELELPPAVTVNGVGVLTDWWQKRPTRVDVHAWENGRVGQRLAGKAFPKYVADNCGEQFVTTCAHPDQNGSATSQLFVPLQRVDSDIAVVVDGQLSAANKHVYLKAIRVYGSRN